MTYYDNGVWLTFHSILDLMSIYEQTTKVRCYELSLIIMNRQKSIFNYLKYSFNNFYWSLKYFTDLDTTYILNNTENQHCNCNLCSDKMMRFHYPFFRGFYFNKIKNLWKSFKNLPIIITNFLEPYHNINSY